MQDCSGIGQRLVDPVVHHLVLDLRGGGELQEGDQGREHPTHCPPHHPVVADVLGDLIPDRPEDSPVMPENIPRHTHARAQPAGATATFPECQGSEKSGAAGWEGLLEGRNVFDRVLAVLWRGKEALDVDIEPCFPPPPDLRGEPNPTPTRQRVRLPPPIRLKG